MNEENDLCQIKYNSTNPNEEAEQTLNNEKHLEYNDGKVTVETKPHLCGAIL